MDDNNVFSEGVEVVDIRIQGVKSWLSYCDPAAEADGADKAADAHQPRTLGDYIAPFLRLETKCHR